MERENQVEPLKIAKTLLVVEDMESCTSPSQRWSGAWLCLYPGQKEKKNREISFSDQ